MIRRVINSDLKHILHIQRKVYLEDLIETSQSISSKLTISPETCFVHLTGNNVNAYCLCYPFPKLESPPLNDVLDKNYSSENLFVHDLCVSPQYRGLGIAKIMIDHLFEVCRSHNFHSMTLVAVQNSEKFWHKFGFVVVQDTNSSSSYGVDSKLMFCENI